MVCCGSCSPVTEGQIIGTVPERAITHKVMVPPGISGRVDMIKTGEFTVDEIVAVIDVDFKFDELTKLIHNLPSEILEQSPDQGT